MDSSCRLECSPCLSDALTISRFERDPKPQPGENMNEPSAPQVDVSHPRSDFSFRQKVTRAAWNTVWHLLFRPSPTFLFGWRRTLLRFFGARMGKGVRVYPSARIWAPWNLEMGDHSCLGPSVICYSVDKVKIGAHATVSQYAHLCTASHDIQDPAMGLVSAPIAIGAGSWVTTDVFVGPGVRIGEGAVVAARAVVVKDVDPWAVVGGNPARFIKRRELKPL